MITNEMCMRAGEAISTRFSNGFFDERMKLECGRAALEASPLSRCDEPRVVTDAMVWWALSIYLGYPIEEVKEEGDQDAFDRMKAVLQTVLGSGIVIPF